jgi:bifunctional non-homologous end joining protein LigD
MQRKKTNFISLSNEEIGMKVEKMPHPIKPMMARQAKEPFDQANWIFETRWEGSRTIAELNKGEVKLYSKNHTSFNEILTPIYEDLKQLKMEAVFDGVVVGFDEEGKTSFQFLQNCFNSKQGFLVYYIFDLLYLDGYDLQNSPLVKRKKLLKTILPDSPHLKYCDHVEEKGTFFFAETVKQGHAGILAKNGSSSYLAGKKSSNWLKINAHYYQEAIICGFTPPKGRQNYLGSLILGIYEKKKLVHMGNARIDFDQQHLKEIYNRLMLLTRKTSPFKITPKLRSLITWVEPKLVCEVKFAEWTHEGKMHHPIAITFKEDRKPEEIVKEKASTRSKRKKYEPSLYLRSQVEVN